MPFFPAGKRESNPEPDRTPIDAFKERERKNVRFDTQERIMGEGKHFAKPFR